MLLLHFLGKKANSSCTLAQGMSYLTRAPRAIQKEGKLLWSNAVIPGTKTELGAYVCSCPIPITFFFLHQDMARAVYGAGFYPSVSLSIALHVKCMRILSAVKNLLFPHFLADKLSLLWFSICAGCLVTHLVCFPRNFFPKSWKWSREGAAVQAVFNEGRVWGKCEGVSSAACGFPEAHPGPFLSFLHQLHMSSLTVPSVLWCWWMSLDSSEMVGSCRTPVGMLCGCFHFSEGAAGIGRGGACWLHRKVWLSCEVRRKISLAAFHQSCSFWRGDEIQTLVLVLLPDSQIAVWLSILESLTVHSSVALSFTWESQKSLSSHLGEFLENISHPCSFFWEDEVVFRWSPKTKLPVVFIYP